MKRILVTGTLGMKIDSNALGWLIDSVVECQPDAIICIEASIELLNGLREVHAGPIGVHSGAFELHHRVEELPKYFDAAPGWVSTSLADSVSLSRIGGNTALGAARKLRKSVVMGHTHRLGIISESYGYAGNITQQVIGMEVGTLTDPQRNKQHGWRQGFGLLACDGESATAAAVVARS